MMTLLILNDPPTVPSAPNAFDLLTGAGRSASGHRLKTSQRAYLVRSTSDSCRIGALQRTDVMCRELPLRRANADDRLRPYNPMNGLCIRALVVALPGSAATF